MLKGSKISRYRILKLIDCYCLGLEASKTAVLLKLNRNTVNRYYGIFREILSKVVYGK
jgi:transposase-like protein